MTKELSSSSWCSVKFTDILDVQGGTQPPKSQFISEPKEGYVRLLQIRDFGKKPVPTYIPDTRKLKKCSKDNVLIGRYGASLGRICTNMAGAYNVALAKVLIPSEVSTSFIKYYLLSELFQEPLRLLSRSAQNGFNKDDLATFNFVLPPLAEQKQISVELDELLAQVESIKNRLDAIPTILKRFKKSVLTAAVSGKLTEESREKNKFSTISKINERCFEERQLATGKKAKRPKKLDETPSIKLPETWAWVSMDEVSIKITDGTHHSPKSYSTGDFMYVTSKNVREGFIDLSKITYVDKMTHKEIYSRCDVVNGDVLYVKDGANTGLACVNNIDEEISLLSSVGVFRPSSIIDGKYLEHYLNSPVGRKLMLSMMGGTAIKRLTLTKISKSPISLPSIDEQIEIVRRVENLFSFSVQVEQRVKDAQSRVNHLAQSVLVKAFRGELTSVWRENNSDLINGENSADELLKRIKEEREILAGNNKSKKKKAGKRTAA